MKYAEHILFWFEGEVNAEARERERTSGYLAGTAATFYFTHLDIINQTDLPVSYFMRGTSLLSTQL